MKRFRGAVAVVLTAAVIGACGGSSDGATQATVGKGDAADEAADASTTTSSVISGAKTDGKAGSTATTAGSGSTSSGQSGGGSAASTGTDEPDGSELPSEPLPMEVQLSSTCVRPGTPLTVTVNTAPKAQLGYDTTWADGKTGWDAPNRGGTARGSADDSGTWKNTATIGVDAPKGTAKVDVIGTDLTGRMGRTTVEYQVSDSLGKCS